MPETVHIKTGWCQENGQKTEFDAHNVCWRCQKCDEKAKKM